MHHMWGVRRVCILSHADHVTLFRVLSVSLGTQPWSYLQPTLCRVYALLPTWLCSKNCMLSVLQPVGVWMVYGCKHFIPPT